MKILNETKEDPQSFFTQTQLEFEFSLISEQQDTRDIKVSFETVAKTDMLSKLVNKYNKEGDAKATGLVHLNSEDMNKLARELYDNVKVSENISVNYVASEEEDKLISKIIQQLMDKKVDYKTVFDNDTNSIFWSDAYSRPDIQTSWFSDVLKYSDDNKKFYFDKNSDEQHRQKIRNEHSTTESSNGGGNAGFSFPLFGSLSFGGNGASSETETTINDEAVERINKPGITTDDITKLTEMNKVNVKWDGEKFIPKSLDLYRINLKELQNKNEFVFNKIIMSKINLSQKTFLQPDIENDEAEVKPENPVYYEDLLKRVFSMTNTLELLKPQINLLSSQINNISEQINELKKVNQK